MKKVILLKSFSLLLTTVLSSDLFAESADYKTRRGTEIQSRDASKGVDNPDNARNSRRGYRSSTSFDSEFNRDNTASSDNFNNKKDPKRELEKVRKLTDSALDKLMIQLDEITADVRGEVFGILSPIPGMLQDLELLFGKGAIKADDLLNKLEKISFAIESAEAKLK